MFILEILLEYLNNSNLGKYNGNLLLFLLSYALISVFLVFECVIIDLCRKVKDTAYKSCKGTVKLHSFSNTTAYYSFSNTTGVAILQV